MRCALNAWKFAALAVFVSTVAVAQPTAAPSAPVPGPVPTDFLQVMNEAAAAVKVEFFPGNVLPRDGVRPLFMSCVNPKQAVYWPLEMKTGEGTIRAQMTRAPECGGQGFDQVACTSQIQRTPRLRHVAVRSNGKACAIEATSAPAGASLKSDKECGPTGHWAPLTIENKTEHGLWVTVYENKRGAWGGGPPILAAACWMPREKRMACVDKRKLILRAEATNNNPNRARARSCSERVYRDTDIMGGFLLDMGRWNQGYYVSYSCYGHECRWD